MHNTNEIVKIITIELIIRIITFGKYLSISMIKCNLLGNHNYLKQNTLMILLPVNYTIFL